MCDNCDNETGFLRKCSRCGKMLCIDCIQLENHSCLPIKRSWDEYGHWQRKLKTVKQREDKNSGKINNDGVIFLNGSRVITREVYIVERVVGDV